MRLNFAVEALEKTLTVLFIALHIVIFCKFVY